VAGSSREAELRLLMRLLVREFGMFNHPGGEGHEEPDVFPFYKNNVDGHSYIKIACTLERLEFHAEKMVMKLAVRREEVAFYGCLYEPFTRKDKATDTFSHPNLLQRIRNSNVDAAELDADGVYTSERGEDECLTRVPLRSYNRGDAETVAMRRECDKALKQRQSVKVADNSSARLRGGGGGGGGGGGDEKQDAAADALELAMMSVDHTDAAGKDVMVCGCDLFLPYHKQIIVRERLNVIFSELLHPRTQMRLYGAVGKEAKKKKKAEEKARRAAQKDKRKGKGKEEGKEEMVEFASNDVANVGDYDDDGDNDAIDLKATDAVDRARRDGMIECVYPLSTLRHEMGTHGTGAVKSDFFPSTKTFTKKSLSWKLSFSCVMSFTRHSRYFIGFYRAYFGEKIALYFAFLHYYTTALSFLSIAGLVCFVFQRTMGNVDSLAVPVYSILACLWSSIFLQTWTRKANVWAYRWGMGNHEATEDVLPAFIQASHQHAHDDVPTSKQRSDDKDDNDYNNGNAAKKASDRNLGFYNGDDWVDMSSYVDEVERISVEERQRLDKSIAMLYERERSSGGVLSDADRLALRDAERQRTAADVEVRSFVPYAHRRRDNFCTRCCSMPYRLYRRIQKIVTLSLVLGFTVVIVIITLALMAERLKGFSSFFGGLSIEQAQVLGGIANGVLIFALDAVLKEIAIKLNDWEHHRTATAYEDALISKLFFFQFVNGYTSLFYIAFFKGVATDFRQTSDGAIAFTRDRSLYSIPFTGLNDDYCKNTDGTPAVTCMNELSTQLTVLFMTRVFIGNMIEFGIPWLKGKLAKRCRKSGVESVLDDHEAHGSDVLKTWDHGTHFYAWSQSLKPPYVVNSVSGTFYDYNEMALQFGYVLLFAPAFPLAPAIALLSNVIENRVDGLKLFISFQKPEYAGAEDIGYWKLIFKFLAVLAVTTNCTMMFVTSGELAELFGGLEDSEYVLIAVFLEHILLFVQFFASSVIDDKPAWLRDNARRAAEVEKISVAYQAARRDPAIAMSAAMTAGRNTDDGLAERAATAMIDLHDIHAEMGEAVDDAVDAVLGVASSMMEKAKSKIR
jgi:hypothetical protein